MTTDSATEADATRASLDLAAEIYARYARGDRDLLMDRLAEDVAWTSLAAPELPWAGTWRGRAGVEDYFAALGGTVTVTAYELERLVAQGEWVIALARGTGRFRPTGEEITIAKADAMRFVDGRLVEFREYHDSAALLGCLARCGGNPA
jgi:hypothetical protein